MLPSVVIIAYNEEERLKTLLPLLHDFEEVILVDSHSTDNTSALCENFKNVKHIQHPFEGFGLQKQFAAEQAKSDWILSLDADEYPDDQMLKDIKSIFSKGNPEYDAYYIKRQLHFLGKTFKYGKESKDYQLRLFNRTKASWAPLEVHEYVEYAGTKGKLKGSVAHHSYKNLDNYIGKFNRYTSLAAAELAKKNKRYSPLQLWIKFHFTFFRSYIIQANFLNGYAGWIWSVYASLYTLSKYAKLNEHSKRF